MKRNDFTETCFPCLSNGSYIKDCVLVYINVYLFLRWFLSCYVLGVRTGSDRVVDERLLLSGCAFE